MLRGIKVFICKDCGASFKAPDVEWMATRYSSPPVCPNCGSRNTRPRKMKDVLRSIIS